MNIYVGNLPYRLRDADLESMFNEFGSVKSAKVIMDHELQRSKGFGFVEMDDADGARKAIEGLNGADLDGRALKVNEARPRPERGGGGGGNGGGGRRW